ncbi:Nucleotide-binding universal stress protein, UspA family [Salegentibacter holothuriorum]|uniref:Nucleotide-binding universal stress protein, UspA family n=1 Tax=Salegentibacter holothuriorum TaxID=241145 RepID=A0A1T5BY25_9FLAO|nr:universal stress protein [Salegentibacter holothuriorum]SKB51903.1 Nucleotide-binding universal stress protein, UspA family [Salegentibacter holothuriorum]
MKNLLIPFDFSDVSMNALDYATKFGSKCQKATIHLLYISKSKLEKDKENELKSNFEELLEKYQGPGAPPISYYFRTGNFSDAIVDAHKSLDTDLVLMGTSGAEEGAESPVTRTSRLVLEADLPVLVIPVSHKYFKLDKILLALGEDVMHDTSTLNLLLDVSSRSEAEVDVLTVSRNPEGAGYSEADEINENTLQYYLEMFYSHHSFAENEDILQGIDDYIKKHQVDMLAIMPKTHSNNSTPSKGKLTMEVTLKSDIPVLVLD